MTAPDDRRPGAGSTRLVAVTVRRTGGFAGIPRQWEAHPAPEDPILPDLVDRCPWEAAAEPRAPAVDRFVWVVTARWEPGGQQRVVLSDETMTGPWRALVDAVREATAS
ncbi:protealysin inhibitor emfourin [Microbacterium sp. SSW1-59]|uniref:protealysin inhibitor emfourin n=1 Tax=Microbacterium xanthum TaxID=3079794 RepID=UPI002AD50D22|nr:protealysin inhibitor emfourin [Microbacterium sp. SSW1-59]MDZ8201649.1 protealysin inhibitor emfourin [Microbacterium sp. SSW1-59]